MNESILISMKKLLGIQEDYEHFDPDLIIHINSIFSILHQLGVGTTEPFRIRDKETTWGEFLEDETKADMCKSYMYLRLRLIFDPPTIGSLMEAIKSQISEYEWRLTVATDKEVKYETKEDSEEVNWGD